MYVGAKKPEVIDNVLFWFFFAKGVGVNFISIDSNLCFLLSLKCTMKYASYCTGIICLYIGNFKYIIVHCIKQNECEIIFSNSMDQKLTHLNHSTGTLVKI